MSGISPDPEFPRGLIALLPRLRRYARVLTRDAGAADDLVQDTLERAWTRQRQWRPGSDLRAWLFSIMHNRHVDLVRGSLARPEAPALRQDDEAWPAEPADAGGHAAIDPIDLQRCFERLSGEHRQVLMLVAVEELSYDEAARAMGVPVGTVMSRLSRARARLRAELADDAGRPGARLTRIK